MASETDNPFADLCERGIYDLVELIKTGGTHDAGGNLELLQPGIVCNAFSPCPMRFL